MREDRPKPAPQDTPPMWNRLFTSLRARLIALLLVAMLPVLVLDLVSAAEQRHEGRARAADEAKTLSRSVAHEHAELLVGTRQLLATMAQVAAVRDHDTASCTALFTDILQANPRYIALSALHADGTLFCSTLPFSPGQSMAGLPAVQRAVAGREFALGDYQVGRVTKKAIIIAAYPVLDAEGNVQTILTASISLEWLNHYLASLKLPPATSVLVVDSAGVVLAGMPDAEPWLGQPAPEYLLRAMQGVAHEGTWTGRGLDDEQYLFGVVHFATAQGGICIVAGVPLAQAYAGVDRRLARDLMALALALALALGGVWFGGNRAVLRPTRVLAAAAQRIAAGDLGARVSRRFHLGELERVAAAFDHMAGSLQEREAALRQSEERLTRIIETMADGLMIVDAAGYYVTINAAAERILGLAREHLIGCHYLAPPWTRRTLDDKSLSSEEYPFEVVRRTGQPVYDVRFCIEHGDTHAILSMNAAPLFENGQFAGMVALFTDITEKLRAQQALEYQNTTLAALHETSIALMSRLDVNEILHGILNRARELSGATSGVICIASVDGEQAEARVTSELATEDIGKSLRRGEGVVGLALATGVSQVVNAYDTWPGKPNTATARTAKAAAAVPILAGERVLGVIALAHTERGAAFTPAQVQVLERLAQLAAVALENARLVEAVRAELHERVRAEERLRQSERILRLINDNTDSVIFAWDMERRRTYINPAIEKLTGYTVQEITEQPASLWIHPDDIEPMGLVWERAFAGHTYAGDYRVITKTGQLKWCHAEGGPIYDEAGQQIGVQASVRDITERKQVEAALRESEERFKALVQHAADLTTIVDAAGVIRYISPAIERIGGYRVDELVGVRMADLVHPDDLALMLQKHRERLDQPGVPVLGVARFRHRDGSWRYLEGYGTNYLDNPAIGGIVFNSRDVTEQKQTEAELALRAEELARSNEELQRFAYVASHDLQEPLRMVASYTQLLQRRYADQLDADANAFIEYAVDGARRMQQLIRDLLEYSRVGTRAKEPQPVDAAAALDDALANLHVALAESGAEIRRGPLPVVLADASQLTQVFQNLIGNAIKFRGAAAPRIEVGAVRAGAAWRFFVADNGIGIDPQYAERIFAIFQRLHTREEYPGTGIGLAICKKIVERHGGRIWVESRLGAGATFNFTLPVYSADGYADGRERQAG